MKLKRSYGLPEAVARRKTNLLVVMQYHGRRENVPSDLLKKRLIGALKKLLNPFYIYLLTGAQRKGITFAELMPCCFVPALCIC